MLYLGVAAILLVGVSLGFLGAGGAAIALPVLVYLIGMEPHQAVVFSLMLVGGVSLFGAFLNARKRMVDWLAAASFAPTGVAGAWLGAAWSSRLSGRALLLAFSALLTVVGLRMLFDRNGSDAPAGSKPRLPLIAAAAFAIGIITGVLGVGGGFVIVPAMVYLAGLDMRKAVATSLAVIALNSAAAFLRHTTMRQIDWPLAAMLLISAATGMAVGVWLAHRTDSSRLKRYFGVLLIALAAVMIAKSL